MQWLAKICVRRPVFASVLMLVLVVLGAAGYIRLGVDEFPNVDFPIVVVTVRLPGSSPRELESEVTDKVESSINTISGVESIQSFVGDVSQTVISFNMEKPVDVAVQEVRDKMQQVTIDLPKGIDPPVVTKVDPSAAPVMLLAVRASKPIREITELVDKVIRRKIETIYGVGQVSLIGGRKRQIRVWLDPSALRARSITVAEVQGALATQNLITPGGNLEAGPYSSTVRIEGRATSTQEIARIVVRQIEGSPVRIQDIGRVEDGEEDAKSYAQLDGERTVVLSVVKQAGTNTVAVVDAVQAQLAEVRKLLPPGTTLDLVRDNSAVIRTGIHAVLEHLILGAFLAALVVLLFLGNARSTIIAAVAIPISVIGTFAVMKLAGFTLNSMTLLALALAVGIVIDDAIVVLENIMRWIEEKERKPFVAAVLATKEIGLAVLATTLSLMAVFVPVALMGGLSGRFLSSFGLTMAFSIAVSMLVSFTLTPMLCARLLRMHEKGNFLTRLVDKVYGPIERGYLFLLRWAMRHRWVIVLAMIATLGSCIPIAKQLPFEFLPTEDRGQFDITVRAPEGTTLEETRLVVERLAVDAKSLPAVGHILITVGEDAQQTPNLGTVRVFLTEPSKRKVSQQELMQYMRQKIFPNYPKTLKLKVAEVQAFSIGSSMGNIVYAITGTDLDQISQKSQRIIEELKKEPSAVDVDSTLILGKPEVQVFVDRDRAADLGVRVSDIANTLQLLVAGLKATTYAEAGEQYDIQVRADAKWRVDPQTLSLVDVPSSKQGMVPLLSVVRFENAEGPAIINRLDRQREVTISANAAPGYGENAVMDAIKRIANKEGLPLGGQLLPLGRTKEQGKAASGFLLVFVLAFVFMYLVLAAQFESWSHPFTILLTLPLTVPFAFLSLLLFGQSLNIFSGLGLLVLFGVVKKNAILQVDQTNQQRERGLDRAAAILEANRERLRPILMTTLAFVAGMIPLMLSKGIGAEKNQATSGIVLGGQTFSLLLTLLAAPVTYSLLDDLSSWFSRLRKKKPADRGEQELDDLLGESTLDSAVKQSEQTG